MKTKVSLKTAAASKSTKAKDAFEKVASKKTTTKAADKKSAVKTPKVAAEPPKAAKVKVNLEVTLTLTKETPGTYVFTTDADDAPVTQIYVKKSGLPKGAPKSITITIN